MGRIASPSSAAWLNIVRLKDDKESLKGRMEMASWNDRYLLELLRDAVGKF